MQITEQSSLYDHLENKSIREILEDINREDPKVTLAVQTAIPQIERLASLIVPRMKQGGRVKENKMVNMQLYAAICSSVTISSWKEVRG